MDTKKLAQSSMAAVTQNLQRKRKRRRKIRRQLKPNKLLIVFLFAFEINYGKYTLIVFLIQNCIHTCAQQEYTKLLLDCK